MPLREEYTQYLREFLKDRPSGWPKSFSWPPRRSEVKDYIINRLANSSNQQDIKSITGHLSELRNIDTSNISDVTNEINSEKVKTIYHFFINENTTPQKTVLEAIAAIFNAPLKNSNEYLTWKNKDHVTIINNAETAPKKVNAPVIKPKNKDFSGVMHISIKCPGTEIRYTLDGNEPDEQSAMYSGPITIKTDTTIKAKAYKESCTPSETVTAEYQIAPVSPRSPSRRVIINITISISLGS